MLDKQIANKKLDALLNQLLPEALLKKGHAVNKEQDTYAADELVELGEEILCQLAAFGFVAYLQQAKQKEVYNDFLINLFTSKGHDYNAGPLYRWAANMLLEAVGEMAEKLRPFFWQQKEGKLVLNAKIHHLAALRNEVMHGFFVLPPERNNEEAEKMALVLGSIVDANLFEQNWGTFHFLSEKGFNGKWNITEEAWQQFNNCYAFGTLAERIRFEYGEEFNTEEEKLAHTAVKPNTNLNNLITEFLAKNKKSALSIWHRPNDENGPEAYRTAVQLIEKENLIVYYTLHETGITYTSGFLLRQIIKVLAEETKQSKYSKEPLTAIKDLKKISGKRVVVILNQVHLGLFNKDHVLQLANELFDLEIPLICIGEHYTYLDRFFNQSHTIVSPTFIPSEDEWKKSLHNYLRFKGPNKELKTDAKDYQLLETIINKMLEALGKNEVIVARRFADDNNFPIEFVHECFAFLNPYFNSSSQEFEKDVIDELYEFPVEIKETSQIFLSLGRRDIKLEYKHKVLSI